MTYLYRDGGVFLADDGGSLCLGGGCMRFRLSSHPYEPCTYIHRPDGSVCIVHNAFNISELYESAQSGKPIRLATGHEYDPGGLCRLLLFAAGLGEDSFDITWLEGRYFIGMLDKSEAISQDTAVDLTEFGLVNRNIMNMFIHAKRIGMTADGRYYIRRPYR